MSLKGTIVLPGDKSIAHRAVIVSAIAEGKTRITHFPANDDCRVTVTALKKLGIRIDKLTKPLNTLMVYGKGLYGLKKPHSPLFIGESGTTLRVLLGVLAGQDFSVTLTAGRLLSRRPMRRVAFPLRLMGAKISGRILAHGQPENTLLLLYMAIHYIRLFTKCQLPPRR